MPDQAPPGGARPPLPRLYAVTDQAVAGLPDLASRARAIARAGQVALVARAPGLLGRAHLALVETLERAARGTTALLVVHDRLDLARIAGARAVHLPAGGFPVDAARALLGPEVLIGCSTHSAEEARRAHAAGADYVFLGPIWETPSHPGSPPLGLEALARAAPAPVVAIGGVTAQRAAQCRAAGAVGVAVISAVWHAADPGGAAREILLSFDREPGQRDGGLR